MTRRSIAAAFVALASLGFVALVAMKRLPPTGMGWFMAGFGAMMGIHLTPAGIITFDTQGQSVPPLSVPRAEVVLIAGRYIQEILIPLPAWPLLTATLLCMAASIAVLWMDRRRA